MNTSAQKQEQPVDVLGADARAALDRDGHVALAGIVSDADVAAMRVRVEAAAADAAAAGEGGRGDAEPLVGELFERAWTHPRLLAAVAHILGDEVVLTGLGFRCPAPGHGAQLLHVDHGHGVPAGEYQVCSAFLALVAFGEENGATRVVPGTHVYGRIPPVKPLTWRHPQERRLLGPAGTVFVFNGHLWHSGMPNRSQAARPALVMSFGRPGASGRMG